MRLSFPSNVGPADRAMRVALGVVLLGFALACPFAAAQGPLVIAAAGIVGLASLVTGMTGSCWLYARLGITTRRT